jgi:hypothetical protein
MKWSLTGTITAVGFASGDRFVVGHWDDTPIGTVDDIMWARPDGGRILLVGDQPAADLITAVYTFDEVRIVPVTVGGGERWLEATAGPVEVQLKAAVGWRVPFARPTWLTQWVESPLARATLGVRTYGTNPAGVREWYRADVYRRVTTGWATIDGTDLGALGPLDPGCRFGFEPPRSPSIVALRTSLEDPSGHLDDVVRTAARARAATLNR